MASVTIVKFVLMIYCRSFKNEIVRAYAQDHFFDVITNSIGLVSSLLAAHYYWWMDPVGAILVILYHLKSEALVLCIVPNSLYYGSIIEKKSENLVWKYIFIWRLY